MGRVKPVGGQANMTPSNRKKPEKGHGKFTAAVRKGHAPFRV